MFLDGSMRYDASEQSSGSSCSCGKATYQPPIVGKPAIAWDGVSPKHCLKVRVRCAVSAKPASMEAVLTSVPATIRRAACCSPVHRLNWRKVIPVDSLNNRSAWCAPIPDVWLIRPGSSSSSVLPPVPTVRRSSPGEDGLDRG